jgi:hypothetical protein
MILQLFIFAILFILFGLYTLYRKKWLVGSMFVLMGILLFVVASAVVIIYPDKWPL